MRHSDYFLRSILLCICVLLMTGCEVNLDTESEKDTLFQTDLKFSDYAQENGIARAFAFFAADSAIIYRDQSDPIKGKEKIAELFKKRAAGTLHWTPFFVDVAQSSDIGYTLGQYVFSSEPSDSNKFENTGYYVTIWKKQTDGQWKYVFDSGVQGPQRTK